MMENEFKGRKSLLKLGELLLKFRVPIIIIVLAISAISAYYYGKIPRDPSVEAMVLEDDPDLLAYNKFKEIFGNDEFVVMAAQVPTIFDKTVISNAAQLCNDIEKLPHIKEAVSYANIRTVHGTEDSIIVEKLIEEIPETAKQMADLKKQVMAESDYIGNFYSKDAKTFAVFVRLLSLKGEEDSTETRTALTSSLRNLTKQEPYSAYRWYVAGTPILKNDLANTQKQEDKKFQIMIFLILSVMLYLIFRTGGGVFVTLIAVQSTIFMLYAGHYFSGIPLSMVSSILTPLMLIYGVSSSVHIQTHYALQNIKAISGKNALIAAVGVTVVPCLFNSVTTAVGLGSNMISPIKPIREFAMFASIGIGLSFLASFLLVPTILSFFPKPGKATAKANETGLRVHVLEFVVKIVLEHRNKVLLVCGLMLAVAIYGMTLIKVETKLLEYFKADSEIRQSYDFVDANLSGVSSMEIMVDTGKKGGMKDPKIIAKIDELSKYLTSEEKHLTSVTSLINFYKRINMALNGDKEEFKIIPKSRPEAAQYLLLYSMSGPKSDLFNYASRDYRYGRISLRIETLSSSKLQTLVARIKHKVREIFEPIEKDQVKVSVTGAAVLYANMNSQLVSGQLKSFGVSLLLISLMMILVAGEIGLGLVSLLPNLMPIAMTMGVMGFLGYSLDSTTAMVAPIALGMAVDSTIHFMVRFRRDFLDSKDYNIAAAKTIRLIGRAMVGTSIPLAAGFFVLTTSIFMPVFVFGLLSGVVILLAMVFDLILTPICMILYRPTYKKKGLVDFFD